MQHKKEKNTVIRNLFDSAKPKLWTNNKLKKRLHITSIRIPANIIIAIIAEFMHVFSVLLALGNTGTVGVNAITSLLSCNLEINYRVTKWRTRKLEIIVKFCCICNDYGDMFITRCHAQFSFKENNKLNWLAHVV